MVEAVVSQKGRVIMRSQFDDATINEVTKKVNDYIQLEALNEEGICSVTVGFKTGDKWNYNKV